MMQDTVRTGTYQRAIFENPEDFRDKVVLDVGTGSGVLAFFAAAAGAKKVYAVEMSAAADLAEELAAANGYGDVVTVLRGKIEEVVIPEKVDVIISEPIGFLLVHERMLESYVVARDRFLKPGGLMYPSLGSIIFAPITDDALYKEQLGKIEFWQNKDFFGIDLSSSINRANIEYFSQPVVGTFPSSNLLSQYRTVHSIDFSQVTCEELQSFDIKFSSKIDQTGIMHGLGCWFDLLFNGTAKEILLSTSPDFPTTHWYQCRLLLAEPLAVNKGQTVSGTMRFEANDKFSYLIHLEVTLDGTTITSTNKINLHDQIYHYLYDQNGR